MNLQEFQNTVDSLIVLYKHWELLKSENAQLVKALKEIADQDYRGNRPITIDIARAALEGKE